MKAFASWGKCSIDWTPSICPPAGGLLSAGADLVIDHSYQFPLKSMEEFLYFYMTLSLGAGVKRHW